MTASPDQAPTYFTRHQAPSLAYRYLAGEGPTIIWLGGFGSDMLGTKAGFLHDWCQENGRAFLRFDYSAHGESEGVFEEYGIGDWAKDALDIIQHAAPGPCLLVGSSMGGWISCLLARDKLQEIKGMVLIAPAPDFTKDLMWPSLSEADQQTILSEGKLVVPSEYDDTEFIYSKTLFDQGAENLIFEKPLTLSCPVHILQGMEDEPVPWAHAMRLACHIAASDLTITMTKTGDHRLSTSQDLITLRHTLTNMLTKI